MKKIVLASATLIALATFDGANAADMALKAPPKPVSICTWCGFYAGLNAGYGWGRASDNSTSTGVPAVPAAFSAVNDMRGWLGGAQIGYNWQIDPKWLFGLETDIQGTGQKGSATLPTIVTGAAPFAPGTITTGNLTQKLPWFGTLRARLGYEPTSTWLLYVTGGLAYGQINSTGNLSVTAFPPGTTAVLFSSSANDSRLGWTIGAGSEWMISNGWSAKLEYLYMDLGSFTDTFVTTAAGPTITNSTRFTDSILRVGLNYHFK